MVTWYCTVEDNTKTTMKRYSDDVMTNHDAMMPLLSIVDVEVDQCNVLFFFVIDHNRLIIYILSLHYPDILQVGHQFSKLDEFIFVGDYQSSTCTLHKT